MSAHDSHGTHASHDGHGHGDAHDFAHPMPVWQLLAVFFALIFFTILTVAQASMHLGAWEVWICLFIATIKATLVIAYFMHLRYDKSYNAVVFLASFLFVAIFMGFTLMDRSQYEETLDVNTTQLP